MGDCVDGVDGISAGIGDEDTAAGMRTILGLCEWAKSLLRLRRPKLSLDDGAAAVVLGGCLDSLAEAEITGKAEAGNEMVCLLTLPLACAGDENMPGLIVDSADKKLRTRSGGVLTIVVTK